jgi:hypothetical protein
MNWHVGRATGLASRRIMKSASRQQRWLSHVPELHLPPTRCALCLKCAAPQIIADDQYTEGIRNLDSRHSSSTSSMHICMAWTLLCAQYDRTVPGLVGLDTPQDFADTLATIKDKVETLMVECSRHPLPFPLAFYRGSQRQWPPTELIRKFWGWQCLQ